MWMKSICWLVAGAFQLFKADFKAWLVYNPGHSDTARISQALSILHTFYDHSQTLFRAKIQLLYLLSIANKLTRAIALLQTNSMSNNKKPTKNYISVFHFALMLVRARMQLTDWLALASVHCCWNQSYKVPTASVPSIAQFKCFDASCLSFCLSANQSVPSTAPTNPVTLNFVQVFLLYSSLLQPW